VKRKWGQGKEWKNKYESRRPTDQQLADGISGFSIRDPRAGRLKNTIGFSSYNFIYDVVYTRFS